MARGIPYTPEDEKLLWDNYKSMNNAELAKKLGRPESSIAQKLSQLGLTRYAKRTTARTKAAKPKKQPPK